MSKRDALGRCGICGAYPEECNHGMTEGRADRAAPDLPKRTAKELARDLRTRAGYLSGEKWEIPATGAMMREAADLLADQAASLSALRDQLAQAISDVLAVAKEIRDEARDCRRSAGIPCQSEYSWHAAIYEGWAARLEAATYQHGGAASVVGGLSANHQAVALTDTLRQQVRQLADEMEAAAPLLNEWADRFRELAQ
jgi:hypothetical protein